MTTATTTTTTAAATAGTGEAQPHVAATRPAAGVPARPRLRRGVRLRWLDDALTLTGGATRLVLRGRSVLELLPRLLPLLDGTRTVDRVAADLPDVAPDVVTGALQVLHAHRVLADGPAAAGDGAVHEAADEAAAADLQDDYWALLGDDGGRVPARLAAARALVLGDGRLARACVPLLRAAGVGDVEVPAPGGATAALDRLAAAADGTAVALLCLDGPDPAGRSELHAHAVAAGVPVLPVALGDDVAAVGPFVLPRRSACDACLAARLVANESPLAAALGLAVPGADDDAGPGPDHPVGPVGPTPAAAPAFVAPLVAATAVGEAVRYLAGGSPTSLGGLLRLRLRDGSWTRHEVLKLPRCPVCGPGRHRPLTKIWDFEPVAGGAGDAAAR